MKSLIPPASAPVSRSMVTFGRSRRPVFIKAFSLVEVTLALGLMSFSLVALMGLLVNGLTGMRSSHEQNAANYLLEQISADIKTGLAAGSTTSPIYRIPLANTDGSVGKLAAPVEYAGSQFVISHRFELNSNSSEQIHMMLQAAWPVDAAPAVANFSELSSTWISR